jgi:beta-N-acetylhexosaminidase
MRRIRTQPVKYLIISAILIFSFLPLQGGLAAPQHQTYDIDSQISDLLESMSPEERVGQLFLVTFKGTSVDSETQIYDLINSRFVGGVVLLADNNNFTASTYNLNDLYTLISQLQVSRYSSSQIFQADQTPRILSSPAYIPLFIGISQEGDGHPHDQILSGLTPLPSLLSIGATWNTELSRQVGAVAGHELSDIGINLFFGPSLDILENPLLQGANQLGARSFGGDPYWVGEMGRSYIRGLHEGSDGRMLVVGTHFPGLGSADHIPENEVATVRKSLEQLKQIELVPFFTVTGGAITETEKVDALLTSHIRYQGLQGNIRSTTRPIGFDQQALSLLMDLPAFSAWRDDGGLMISDDLGSRAVRRFYDPTEQEFNARKLALDAFLAGNDLLYLNNFIEAEDPDTYTTIIRTIEYFTQKYQEDPLFAERVNQSVTRILALKFKVYDAFDLDVVVQTPNYNNIGFSSQITYDVAQNSVTLISPSITELDTVLPEIPGRTDFVVFITDDSAVSQCSDCPETSVLKVDALSRAVMNLYGPQAGGLVSQYYLRSFSYAQLIQLLDGEGETQAFQNDLNRTSWIIFTMQNVNEKRPESVALKRFLAERPDLISDKRVVVFSTNAPNYLDSTDISKLTAYFGLFSKSEPFIDIAARVLFKEIAQPSGASPVSVPGVGYDLIIATSPNPNQEIPIILNIPEWVQADELSAADNLPVPEYRIGDRIPLKTGVILDSNDHPVPNNTPVQFIITVNGEIAPSISALTDNGVAAAEYIVEQSGTLSIQVLSGLATSRPILFEIPVEEITFDPTPTLTPSLTPTIEPSSTPQPPTPVPTVEPQIEENKRGLEDWFGALISAAFIGWGASRTGTLLGNVKWGVRWGLTGFIVGLSFYTYVVLELPGSDYIMALSDTWGYIIATLIGALGGWVFAFLVCLALNQGAESSKNV